MNVWVCIYIYIHTYLSGHRQKYPHRMLYHLYMMSNLDCGDHAAHMYSNYTQTTTEMSNSSQWLPRILNWLWSFVWVAPTHCNSCGRVATVRGTYFPVMGTIQFQSTVERNSTPQLNMSNQSLIAQNMQYQWTWQMTGHSVSPTWAKAAMVSPCSNKLQYGYEDDSKS